MTFTDKVIEWFKDHHAKVEESDDCYTITHSDGCQMIFDKDWRLKAIKVKVPLFSPKLWCERL